MVLCGRALINFLNKLVVFTFDASPYSPLVSFTNPKYSRNLSKVLSAYALWLSVLMC
jgi:hypothetical protein